MLRGWAGTACCFFVPPAAPGPVAISRRKRRDSFPYPKTEVQGCCTKSRQKPRFEKSVSWSGVPSNESVWTRSTNGLEKPEMFASASRCLSWQKVSRIEIQEVEGRTAVG